jgi:hypothetical protein
MAPRNRTECDREIVTLPAEGHTHKRVAGHRGLKHRTITPALEEMRHCYTTPSNEALMALATCLHWIDLTIDCTDPQDTPDLGFWLKWTMALRMPQCVLRPANESCRLPRSLNL